MKKKILFALALLAGMTCGMKAQSFDQYFTDATLRLDYQFSGNASEQHIAVDELKRVPRWYGKRQRLSDMPVEGNGQITVRDHHTQMVIYRNSFSTLFQEWLSYDEAKTVSKSFENVFLVPMPKDTVDITVDLRNSRREVVTTLTHQVVPSDILIRSIGERDVTPYVYIQQPRDTSRCIHIAYVAEGYTKEEMPIFLDDVRTAHEAIFSHEPFKSHQQDFCITAVESPSEDSGTSIPRQSLWKHTVLSSHFDTFYSDRYLTTLHLKDLHDVLAGTPYEHIIVLVNSSKYGGGGILNSYNLSTTHHAKYRPVVVHEFGHSFAGLADEYAYESEAIPMYPHDVEPWEKNITTRVNFQNKWENLIGKDKKAGFYEGAGYSVKGVYRAYEDCRMRTNENPMFCPACQQALTSVIEFYTK